MPRSGVTRAALPPADLAERWRRARRAAIARCSLDGTDLDDEPRALAAVPVERRDALGEALFSSSWRLGRSAAARFGPTRGVAATAELLAALPGVPCLEGTWRDDGPTCRLERAGCPPSIAGGEAVCDGWREAIDGLVCGLGDGVRFARRESRGHGNARCVDLLHPAQAPALAWGKIPAALAPVLAEIADGLAARRVPVRFLGFAENRLAYRVEDGGIPECGGLGGVVHALVANHVHARLPGLELAAADPRAVL
jgi:hypothetical protein